MATQCIRTRKRFSTPLEDILWDKRQSEETPRIAAEEEARIHREERDGIDISAYEFARDDSNTFLNPDGSATRAAMIVREKVTGRRAIVVCELIDGKTQWSVMGVVSEKAPGFIEVVKARLAFNRRAKAMQTA